ncbi:hypothetical protein [Terasakiella pusilla]|jgi:hypothetical protein|uniref:hypothetical protein n=1 Tax=Terasakiella pusilla TaxID=64973 RepID=UPI003AA85E42
MRNMSFYMTYDAFVEKRKTVTRRFAWADAQVGEVFQGVEKSQGLKAGENLNRLHLIRIVSNVPEKASAICNYPNSLEELAKEGFTDITPNEFVDMLCKAHKKKPSDIVNRIEFEFVENEATP